jgi:hypothetical protein
MRENRTYGSEGGEGSTLSDPYQARWRAQCTTRCASTPSSQVVSISGTEAMSFSV